MPKTKSDAEKLAGKLISAIQKVWGSQTGEPESEESERIMNLAHDLLQAREASNMKVRLSGMSVAQYLGELWLQRHPDVKVLANQLNSEIAKNA